MREVKLEGYGVRLQKYDYSRIGRNRLLVRKFCDMTINTLRK